MTIQRIELDDALEEISGIEKGKLIVFVGAGISNDSPSDCPTWNKLVESVFSSAVSSFRELEDLYSIVSDHVGRLKPEMLCQLLLANLRGYFFSFLDALCLGRPNFNHHGLVKLCNKYSVPLVLTTNFDPYIENAFEEVGDPYNLEISIPSKRLLRSLKSGRGDARTTLLKIHGSADERKSLVLTLRLAGKMLHRDAETLLRTVLEDYTVLVVGYSGNDDDIFPVLLESAAKAKRVYWAVWESELGERIGRFAQSCVECKVVHTNKQPLLALLSRCAGPRDSRHPNVDINGYLLNWSEKVGQNGWANAICSLAIQLNLHHKGFAQIVSASESVIRDATDELERARALRVRAFCFSETREYAEAIRVTQDAVLIYKSHGRHWEIVETLVEGIAQIQGPWSIGDIPPEHLIMSYSGKYYNYYLFGLSYFAIAMVEVREGRIEMACESFLLAAGFSHLAGDSTTLLQILRRIDNLQPSNLEGDFRQEIKYHIDYLGQTLGISYSSREASAKLISFCTNLARKKYRGMILGEIAIFLLVCIFSAVLTVFVGGGAWMMAIAWGGVKIWNVLKLRLYAPIHRY